MVSPFAPVTMGTQSAPVPTPETDLKSVVLGSYDAIYAASMRFPGFQIDKLIAQKGYAIFDDMQTMAAVRSPLNVLRYAALCEDWEVQAAVTDKSDSRQPMAQEIAEAVGHMLHNLEYGVEQRQSFRDVLWQLLLSTFTGFSVAEVIYRYAEEGPCKGMICPSYFAFKPCKQVGFSCDPGTMAVRWITSYTPAGGGRKGGGYDFEGPVDKCLYTVYNQTDGLPFGQGDGRSCYKHYWQIDRLMAFWTTSLERFGGPFWLIKYGQGTGTTLQAAMDAIDDTGSGSSIALPGGFDPEVHTLPAGALDAFSTAINYHSTECAKAILLQTLTTGTGKVGSLALGNVHADTQEFKLAYIRRMAEQVINDQLIRRLVKLNWGAEALELMPTLKLGSDDLGKRGLLGDLYQKMISAGVIWKGESWVRQTLGMPPMDPDDEKRKQAEKEAEVELTARQADAKLQGRAAMSDAKFSAWLPSMTAWQAQAMFKRQELEAAA